MTHALSLSASRLNDYLSCKHRAALWLAGVAPSNTADEAQRLIRDKGFEHEADVLAKLELSHGPATRIPATASLNDRLKWTKDAVQLGAPVIYQAALASGRWVGFPDFLIGCRDENGSLHYQPEDAKLSRRAKPAHVLQLSVYASLVKNMLGFPFGRGVVHVQAPSPETFDLRQTEFVSARLMRGFEEFAVKGQVTRSMRCSACDQCGYQSRCETEWRDADSPIFVAGLTSNQMVRLEASGITTLTALSGLSPDQSVPGISAEALSKLVSQAKLQNVVAAGGPHSTEILPIVSGRGFALLPDPAQGDLFFDMEGDPLYPEGLEYLFGVYGETSAGSKPMYRALWGHDHIAEKAAFEELMVFFADHFHRFPSAHIYHYAQYEESALKRLAMRYASMESELDQMLREQRFVDLFRVTRQALRASTESYSLKDIEKIYWGGRSGDVTNAADSIVQYEKWLLTADGSILDAIAHYNEDDCISTQRLRDWLVSLRPTGADYGLAAPKAELDADATARAAEREARDKQKRELAARVRNSRAGDERVRELIAELLWFHQRSQKPQWWAMFDRQTWSDEELIDDTESLGGLARDPKVPVETVKKSFQAAYMFPPQDTKLHPGVGATISATSEYAGTIETLEAEEGVIVLKRGIAKGEFPLKCSLSPGPPISQKTLAEALETFANRFAADELTDDQAILDFLLREPPRLVGRYGKEPVIKGYDLLAGSVAAVRALDRGTLFIQGPPGTGKTYTTSHSILALLMDGKRVAVSSNSHKAINNVLAAVEERAREEGYTFIGAKKGSSGDAETGFDGSFIRTVQKTTDITEAHKLVGGTAFHFVGDATKYDYLFVDESGQVSLGNLIAMASCARNLVLVGDQMQLSQPIQGVHPGETGLSCLDYFLQNEATVSPQHGILLNISYRMHPHVCQLISDAIYDGRLTAHSSTSQRYLVLGDNPHPALRATGIRFHSIAHAGCTQSSIEEATVIADIVSNLLKQKLHEADGSSRTITLDDIVVVAPFNMQVSRLKQILPSGARVGTVDKFQGQEAAVAIISMTTSLGDEAPRGTEFLFSRNRFNVAISRAQCLAIVVQSSTLQDVSFGSIDDLIRLNLFAHAEAAAAATPWP